MKKLFDSYFIIFSSFFSCIDCTFLNHDLFRGERSNFEFSSYNSSGSFILERSHVEHICPEISSCDKEMDMSWIIRVEVKGLGKSLKTCPERLTSFGLVVSR